MFFKRNKKKLNVLLACYSGRDYALAKKILQSEMLNKLYIYGTNNAAADIAERIDTHITRKVADFLRKNPVDLVIDINERNNASGVINLHNGILKIPSVGISKHWSRLENSKIFAKEFMKRNNIRTPEFQLIEKFSDFEENYERFGFPLVLKKNSLYDGFGAYIVNTKEEAIKILEETLGKEYFDYYENKEIKEKFIMEKYTPGEEASLMMLWDGKDIKPLPVVRDYKRAHENNTGVNTGGLGAYTPVNLTKEQQRQISENIKQLKRALKKEKATDFTGIIYAGLIFSNNKLYTLEYNLRFGDPEGQVLYEHIDCDILNVLYLLANKKVNKIRLKWKKGTTGAVLIVHKEYQDRLFEPVTEYIEFANKNNITFCFSYEKYENNKMSFYKTGKPICLCKNDRVDPFPLIYDELENMKISENLYYRKDIGEIRKKGENK